MTNLTTSAKGLNLIKHWEGFRADAYICPAGKLTIGWGHVVKPNQHLSKLTLAQAEVLLKADCQLAELFINAVLSPTKINGTPLNQNEFDALVCFTFNVGVGALDKSTLLKKLQAGDRAGAADQLLVWNKIHVKGALTFSAGLYKRRVQERALFLEPLPATAGAVEAI